MRVLGNVIKHNMFGPSDVKALEKMCTLSVNQIIDFVVKKVEARASDIRSFRIF